MMPNRIGAKLFFEENDSLDLSPFISIFHKWIRTKAVEGLLIDVADYKHVPNGPGVMLIGHKGDFSIDMADGRPGLRYLRKRGWEEGQNLQGRLDEVLRLLQQGADVLARERQVRSTVHFVDRELQVSFYDQLHTPNTEQTFHALRPTLDTAVVQKYGGGDATMARTTHSSHEALTVSIVMGAAHA